MSETESFGQVMAEMADKVASPYWTDMAERLKRAYDRAIRDTAQQQYSRGYHDGEHSMDAEHRAIAMRLRALPLDGGSHENLSQIARAVYHSDFGWTQGACAALRDELVRLMGGVSDDTCGCAGGGACAAGDGRDSGEQEVSDGRVADDSSGDTGCGDGCGDLHLDRVRITDELRECVSTASKSYDNTPWYDMGEDEESDHTTCHITESELMRVADHIDEQFDRICAQQEAVLQKTIDEMADEIDKMRIEVIELRKQRHNLQVERGDLVYERDELMKQRSEMTAELARRLEQRDAARARTDELSDELLRTRRERDELRAKIAIIRETIDG